MAAVVLTESDYRSPARIRRAERRARTMRDEDVGLAYLCYAYFNPGSNPYRMGLEQDPAARRQPGQRGAAQAEIARIYDQSGAASLRRLVDRIMADLFAQGVDWFSLEPGDDMDPETGKLSDSAERAAARDEWTPELQRMGRTVFRDIHRSNLGEVMPLALLDALIWRVGCLMMHRTETGEAASEYEAEHVSQAEVAFEWSPRGYCVGWYRRHHLSREECEELWPTGSKWTFPQDEDPDNARSTFIEACYRVRGKKAWAYEVMQEQEEVKCFQSGYRRNPLVVFGITGPPGSQLTRSLAELALANTRTLNVLTKVTIEGAEFRAVPSYKAGQGAILGGLTNNRLVPGSVVEVAGIENIAPLEVPADVDVGWAARDQLRMENQVLLYDKALPSDGQRQARTAFEVAEDRKEVRNSYGSMYSRLMNRLGVPVVQHFLDAKYDAGGVEGMRREGGAASVVELDGKEVMVVWENPLAQAQRLAEVEGLYMWLQQNAASMPPEQVQSFTDYPECGRYTHGKLRLPEQVIREPKQAQELGLQAATTASLGGGGQAGDPTRPQVPGASTMGPAAPVQ